MVAGPPGRAGARVGTLECLVLDLTGLGVRDQRQLPAAECLTHHVEREPAGVDPAGPGECKGLDGGRVDRGQDQALCGSVG